MLPSEGIVITILFIHGTGVRVDSYQATLQSIRERLRYPEFPDLRVEGLPWGDKYGSLPPLKSVFRHEETGGKEYTQEDAQSDTWRLLAADPMAAMRFVSLNRAPYAGKPGETKPSKQLNDALEALESPEKYAALKDVLYRSGVEHVFHDAVEAVKADKKLYEDFLKVATRPLDPFNDALADTIVALAISIATERHQTSPFVALDEDLRVELTDAIRKQLGGVAAGWFTDWAKKLGGAVLGATAYAGSFVAVTPYLQWKRGPFSDDASPVAGDILLYQSRGDLIRAAIQSEVERFRGQGDDVVLLAHSLGGVACVDLLLDKASREFRKQVKALITVGSQAPYFYEINALGSLPFTRKESEVEAAFEDFPAWTNIHNRRDFLSYVGKGLFPGRVEDYEVRSRLPFPQSHTSYFTRPKTYDHILTALRSAYKKPEPAGA
jgi:hypothetical protein